MSIISSKDVNEIIRKTLGIINQKIMNHGEITGYIFYKMMEYENAYTDQHYTEQELVDYTMLGILHDIGLYKADNIQSVSDFETKNPWPHSVYGFLFLKYLSPMEDKAEVVLYHHLDYNRHNLIQSRYKHTIELLSLADKMDTFLHLKEENLAPDYFVKYRDIKFSGAALDIFHRAQERYEITENLVNGKYREELQVLLAKRAFSEKYKRRFLEMLVYSIDFRSEHTVIHTLATVNFAEQLGRLARLSGREMRDLHYGALLHDLGKIAIPVSILESTGRLSDEEMKVMKAHVRITEMILEGVVDDSVLQIAVRHHEKLDGTGYHKGLKAEELTLPQQIIAVADILSALYGKRSYKAAFDKEKILDIMNGDADQGKINKNVVTSLERNYDSIIKKFERQKEDTIGLYLKIKEQYAVMTERLKMFD